MDRIPEEIEDIRYCVLDYSNSEEVDYLWIPLIFMETFMSSSTLLQIGKYKIEVPLDWSIVIADKNLGAVEIISISKLNDRKYDFQAFCFNPIKSFMPDCLDVEIITTFPDIKWFVPQLKYGHLLCVPLTDKYDERGPLCAYFVRDANKLPDSLDISKMV
ncbi:MAG: hypothetical protein WC284_08435 [Candidimonas sp.]